MMDAPHKEQKAPSDGWQSRRAATRVPAPLLSPTESIALPCCEPPLPCLPLHSSHCQHRQVRWCLRRCHVSLGQPTRWSGLFHYYFLYKTVRKLLSSTTVRVCGWSGWTWILQTKLWPSIISYGIKGSFTVVAIGVTCVTADIKSIQGAFNRPLHILSQDS